MSTQRIPIDDVAFERLIYPREIKESYEGEPFWYHVDRYYKAMMVGHTMPPIVLAKIDGKNVIIDGYHRWLAHKRLERSDIDAVFIDVKDWNEAFLESVGRNVIHGAPLGKMEMVRAAQRLMTQGGYAQDQISVVVGMPTENLERQIQDRLYVNPTTGEQTILKRPFARQQETLSEAFSEATQSPFSSEYQFQILRQANALMEAGIMDLAKKSVRDEFSRLNQNVRRYMNSG